MDDEPTSQTGQSPEELMVQIKTLEGSIKYLRSQEDQLQFAFGRIDYCDKLVQKITALDALREQHRRTKPLPAQVRAAELACKKVEGRQAKLVATLKQMEHQLEELRTQVAAHREETEQSASEAVKARAEHTPPQRTSQRDCRF